MKHIYFLFILLVCSNVLWANEEVKPTPIDSVVQSVAKTDSLNSTPTVAKTSRRNQGSKNNELSELKEANTNLTRKADSLVSELDSLRHSKDSLQLECDKLIAQKAELQLEMESKEKEYENALRKNADEYSRKVEQSAKMAELAKNKRLSLIILQSAFQVRYNAEYNDAILRSIEVLNYSQTFPEEYQIFYPLLLNYNDYRKELHGFIKKIYITLKNRPTANIQVLHNEFESQLANSRYYKESAHGGSFPEKKKIVYLDRVIDDTRVLFSQPVKCTDAAFEKILKRLE